MQMAHPALNAVVALLCCAPGMHTLSRQCCSALCQAGIAQPLIGLLSAEPDGPRCTEVGFHAAIPDAAICCAAPMGVSPLNDSCWISRSRNRCRSLATTGINPCAACDVCTG